MHISSTPSSAFRPDPGSCRLHAKFPRSCCAGWMPRRLLELVAEGQFREDLYARISTIALELPPLRQRMEDLRRRASEAGRDVPIEFSPDSQRMLRVRVRFTVRSAPAGISYPAKP